MVAGQVYLLLPFDHRFLIGNYADLCRTDWRSVEHDCWVATNFCICGFICFALVCDVLLYQYIRARQRQSGRKNGCGMAAVLYCDSR
ncbi:hypothetical protein D3C87_1682880 [compost metagenome]